MERADSAPVHSRRAPRDTGATEVPDRCVFLNYVKYKPRWPSTFLKPLWEVCDDDSEEDEAVVCPFYAYYLCVLFANDFDIDQPLEHDAELDTILDYILEVLQYVFEPLQQASAD